ncbi:MAG: hypothetical protein KIT22_08200 [Verrucomicrobiae bacterium]|nr:hypothetical protein [Verrucomicrobiae bacterium]
MGRNDSRAPEGVPAGSPHFRLWLAIGGISLSLGLAFSSRASDASPGMFPVETIELPALQPGVPMVRAHTQGLEWVADSIFVTARRDDPAPRRSLLLRTRKGGNAWEVWDLTPPDRPTLDHPGGFQSDGRRLWIPLAESRRRGRSLIRAYALAELRPGQAPVPDVEFAVEDHVGALAVLPERSQLVGAAWDTDTVYVWALDGKLQRTLTGPDLRRRGLGAGWMLDETPGLAVQDWKFVDGALVAGGLVPIPGSPSRAALDRVRWLDSALEPLPSLPTLPANSDGVQMTGEGMAVSEGFLYFLPGDLGATNRMYKMPWVPFRNGACDCNGP